MMNIGIEQEFVFVDGARRYLDGENADYALFAGIVDAFPLYDGDEAFLQCKSLEQRPKRVYVEGFERHDARARRVDTLPKGLEIRTLPHRRVSAVVREFQESFHTVMRLARAAGLEPVLTSRHPFKRELNLDARIGAAEQEVRSAGQLALAKRAMMTHGIHVNVSLEGASPDRMEDLVRKLNHYLPAMIPWSFSSPFYAGEVFEGLCSRNYYRADSRCMTELHERAGSFIIEFRGFDGCGDARLLEAVLRLFQGVVLDTTLAGRAETQDPERLKRSSLDGFRDPSIRAEATEILAAVRSAEGECSGSFDLLQRMLEEGDSYAVRMKRRHAETGSILDSISDMYDY